VLDPVILFPMRLKMNENRRGVKLWMGFIQKAIPVSKGLQHHRHVIFKYAISWDQNVAFFSFSDTVLCHFHGNVNYLEWHPCPC
jgi:hypothetical protein